MEHVCVNVGLEIKSSAFLLLTELFLKIWKYKSLGCKMELLCSDFPLKLTLTETKSGTSLVSLKLKQYKTGTS